MIAHAEQGIMGGFDQTGTSLLVENLKNRPNLTYFEVGFRAYSFILPSRNFELPLAGLFYQPLSSPSVFAI